MGKVGYTRERNKNLTGQSYDTNRFQVFSHQLTRTVHSCL